MKYFGNYELELQMAAIELSGKPGLDYDRHWLDPLLIKRRDY